MWVGVFVQPFPLLDQVATIRWIAPADHSQVIRHCVITFGPECNYGSVVKVDLSW